jgi:transcriptional regulator NrdR family protein
MGVVNGTAAVPCPKCGNRSSETLDSRPSGANFRRRRLCLAPKCGHRYTTIESVLAYKPRGQAVPVVLDSTTLAMVKSVGERLTKLGS